MKGRERKMKNNQEMLVKKKKNKQRVKKSGFIPKSIFTTWKLIILYIIYIIEYFLTLFISSNLEVNVFTCKVFTCKKKRRTSTRLIYQIIQNWYYNLPAVMQTHTGEASSWQHIWHLRPSSCGFNLKYM